MFKKFFHKYIIMYIFIVNEFKGRGVLYMSESLNPNLNTTIGHRQVPNPLVTLDGRSIHSKEDWENIRRPEVIDLFQEHIYGRPPVKRPKSLKFNVVDIKENIMEGQAVRKQIDISYSGPGGQDKFRVLLFVPTNRQKPVPTILFPNIRGNEHMDPERKTKTEFWPAEYIIKRGYATAVFQVSEVAPDNMEKAYSRAHKIFDTYKGKRPPDAWGTIGAWSWGASRVMDYLEIDQDIDHKHVAIVGHSRGGKTALWTGALDERFCLVVSNNSGSTGAAIARGKVGETIEKINAGFPYWFNDNYKSYNHREDELPVDQHMLIASIAPRSVYVTSASEDEWADPQSEFLSLIYATPVYKLYGYEGLKTEQFPANDTPIFGQKMGYHVRTGKHDLTLYDWKNIIDFWES